MESYNSAQLLTVAQTARLLRVHTDTLRRWEQEGHLRPVKTTRRGHFYLKSDILALPDHFTYNLALSNLSSRELLTTLARLVRTISSNLDSRQMAETVMRAAGELMHAERSGIYLFNPAKTQLLPFFGLDTLQPDNARFFYETPLGLDAMRELGQQWLEGRTVYVTDTSTDPRCNRRFFELVDTRALLMAPLKARSGALQGYLGFFWAGKPHLFINEELFFAEALADQTAIALENARLHETVQARAIELETLFETMSDGVAVYDAQLNLVRINKAAKRLMPGLETMLDTPHSERTVQFNLRKLNGSPLPPEETPAYRAAILGESAINFELMLEGESGSETVLTCSATPLYDAKHVLVGAISVFHNFTEQYKAQTRILQLSELAHANAAQLTAVIDSAAQGVLVYDNRSRIVLVNKRLCELYDVSKEEIVGLTSAQFAGKMSSCFQDSARVAAAVRKIEQPITEPYEEEFEMIRPQFRIIQRTVTPVLDAGGNPLGKVALYRDVTEERTLDKAKDEFLSLATHELKTPLTAIIGYTQVLLSRLERYAAELNQSGTSNITPEALLKTTQRINQNAEHLNDLMNDLLDLSRLTTGRFKLQKQPFNLLELVQRLIEQVQITTQKHELQLVQQINLVEPVTGDPHRIEQLIRNLLENAVKYSPNGGKIEIVLSAGSSDPAALAEVQVAVRDQGIGIAPQDQAHLFEKFYRASNASALTVGLGLGLSISTEIVRQHGGRIWVESAGENQGSVFAFTLPI